MFPLNPTGRADPFGAVAVKRPHSAKKRNVSNAFADGTIIS